MSEMSPEQFLLQESLEQLERDRHELIEQGVKIDIDCALDLFRVPTAFRFDRERKQELIILADGDTKDRLGRDMLEITRVLTFIVGFRKNPGNYEPTKLKKQLMAEIYVYSGYNPDNTEWLDLIDMMVPGGERIDLNDENDQAFIKQATEHREVYDMKTRIFNLVVGGAVNSIAQEYGEEIDSSVRLIAVKRCLAMLSLNAYQVEGAIAEVVVETGLPRESIKKLVDAVSYYHIATNGNSSPDLL